MKDTWSQIEIFLREHVPTVVETLNGPATEDDLRQLESVVGMSLPKDFRSYLLIHNGQNDPSRLQTLCEEGNLLSSESIIKIYRMLNEINEAYEPGVTEWWSRKYLPVTDCEGDHLAINLETGAIVMHVHDSGIELGIASSFREWFESKLEIFKQGKFSVRDGYLNYWEFSS